MIFVLDENVSPSFKHIILAVDHTHEVTSIRTLFGQGAEDVVWIRELARLHPQHYVVSGDKGILRRRFEREALTGSGLTFIFLDGWQNVAWADARTRYMKHWPKVITTLALLDGPHLIRLKTNGKLVIETLT